MRIGVGFAISGLALASIVVSAVGVHMLWWRTAEANSRTLSRRRSTSRLFLPWKRNSTAITTRGRAAHTAIRTLFVQNVLVTREADKREFVFLSQLQAQPSISWVAFGWPDGAFFAAHKLGDLGLEMMEIAPVNGVVKRRVDKYQVVVGDIQFENANSSDTDYTCHRTGMVSERHKKRRTEPGSRSPRFPVGLRPSIAYAARSTSTRSVKACSRSSSKTLGSRSFCRNFRWQDRRGVHPGS